MVENKNDGIEYIKRVKELTNMKQICLELDIDYTNVCSGRTSVENIEKVVNKLKANIKLLRK